MFSHEARAALLPVEAAVVVVNAQNGVEPVTERVWKYAEEANVPRIVVVNQMDHPKAGGGGGLSALIDDLHERWGRNCVPVQLPISDAQGFHGVVDLVTMEAFYYTPGGDGRGREIPDGQRAGVGAGLVGVVREILNGALQFLVGVQVELVMIGAVDREISRKYWLSSKLRPANETENVFRRAELLRPHSAGRGTGRGRPTPTRPAEHRRPGARVPNRGAAVQFARAASERLRFGAACGWVHHGSSGASATPFQKMARAHFADSFDERVRTRERN